jgi:hypothetical protein
MSGAWFPWWCQPTPNPPAPPVAFDSVYFQANYPELANVTGGVTYMQMQFNIASMYCDNTGGGPVPNTGGGNASPPNPLYLALHMLTAHLVKLNGTFPQTSGTGTTPPSPLVGRISNAAEGTVNVATENQYPPGSPQWFQQTPYGAQYWQMTLQYRTGFYRGASYRRRFGITG